MQDVQLVFPKQAVPLNSVRLISGFVPHSLDILGSDFGAVDSVLINDFPSPSIVVLSKNRLLAQVPPSMNAGGTISSVVVISSQLTVTPKSLLTFELGTTSRKTSGILRLVQLFLKILLTTPGKDIYSPRIGGGAMRNIGNSFGREEGGGVVSDFIVAVAATQKQIVAIQTRNPTIPRDEKLLSARVLQADFNQAEAALLMSIDITSQAGSSATANLTV